MQNNKKRNLLHSNEFSTVSRIILKIKWFEILSLTLYLVTARQRKSVKGVKAPHCTLLISMPINSTMQHFIDPVGALELINPLSRTITFRSVVRS